MIQKREERLIALLYNFLDRMVAIPPLLTGNSDFLSEEEDDKDCQDGNQNCFEQLAVI